MKKAIKKKGKTVILYDGATGLFVTDEQKKQEKESIESISKGAGREQA